MDTIQQVEKAISLNGELLSEIKKRITDTAARLAKAKDLSEKAKVNIKTAKESRQAGLVKGENVNSLSADIAKFEKDLELFAEEIVGLQIFLAELQAEEASLHLTINELPKRILQLRSLELAAQYNSLASQLAPVIEELNAIYHKTSGNSNNQADAVIFYPMEGCFSKLPKIFFDPDGVNLETFVSRHPGVYHTNIMLAESEKCFYAWALHQGKLRS